MTIMTPNGGEGLWQMKEGGEWDKEKDFFLRLWCTQVSATAFPGFASRYEIVRSAFV